MDELDTILAVLGVLVAFSVQAALWGYSVYVIAFWAVLIGGCYHYAPARQYPTADAVTAGVDLTGKICLVTGSSSGIGIDTVRVLALRGATVYMAARNPQKLQQVKSTLEQQLKEATNKNATTTPGTLHTLTCDLNDLKSVKECADIFLKKQEKLHILINNAGIMALPERRPTKQGLEQQMGVCHVGHFYLTQKLLPALEAAGGSRVVILSSSGHAGHNLTQALQDDKLETKPYEPWTAYGNAKASNLLHAKALHDQYYKSTGIAAFSVMPGGILTNLQQNMDAYSLFRFYVIAPFFFKSTSQGAATTLVCATVAPPEQHGGEYYENGEPQPQVLANVVKQLAGDNDGKESSQGGGNDHPAMKLWKKTEALLANLQFN